MAERVQVEVEYQLLNGIEVITTKALPVFRLGSDFPEQFSKGDFIGQPEDEPQGMFLIVRVDKRSKKFVLKEIDCDPIHWKGNEDGIAYGPNENCKKINCSFLNNCPISAHLMMTADID